MVHKSQQSGKTHAEIIPSSKPKQTKITVSCSIEQRKTIRLLAAQEDMSMNEFLLSLVEERKKRRPICQIYSPNELTVKTMEATDRGENLERYNTLNDFWKSIGRNREAETD